MAGKFVKPSRAEVKRFCDQHKYGVDPDDFYDYYESVGWIVGKGKPMKSWTHALALWQRNLEKNSGSRKKKWGERAPTEPKCEKCLDTGYVQIWSEKTMLSLLQGMHRDDIRWETSSAACECEKGESRTGLIRMRERDYYIYAGGQDAKEAAYRVIAKKRENRVPLRLKW